MISIYDTSFLSNRLEVGRSAILQVQQPNKLEGKPRIRAGAVY